MRSTEGTIKNRPSDFKVDEIPLYDPAGNGEHLYLGIRKVNVSHEELVRCIARAFNVKPKSVGTAGRKDKCAITTQTISVHLPGQDPALPVLGEGLDILWSSRHCNKLRTGHLIGNRFSIMIRDIDPTCVTYLKKRLTAIKESGLPNKFGPQRFGTSQNNHILGEALLKRDWNKFAENLESNNQEADAHLLKLLSNGSSPEEICKKIHKPMRKLYLNAFQSMLFNQVLEERKNQGVLGVCQIGDLAWCHVGRGGVFLVTKEERIKDELSQRESILEISPTGPIFGSKMRKPKGTIFALEQEVLNRSGVIESDFELLQKELPGTRRPLRVPVKKTGIIGGVDENGNYVNIQFALPSGSYATVLINELLNVLS